MTTHVGGSSFGTGTIVNNDSATLTVSDATVVEGDVAGDNKQLVFNLTLNNPVDVNVSANFATENGTAGDGTGGSDNDYVAASGTKTINAGATATTIVVNITEDIDIELDETMKVLLDQLEAGGRDVTLAGSGVFSGIGPESVFLNVPEAADYALVYDLAIPNSAGWNFNAIPYTSDNSGSISDGSFDRIAYYLELDTGSGLKYVYASMDAFTTKASQTGVPSSGPNGSFTGSAAGNFQQLVTNMNVVSNVATIVTGTGISTGNIEFWNTNYGTTNAAGIPNASGGVFDFGDTKEQSRIRFPIPPDIGNLFRDCS